MNTVILLFLVQITPDNAVALAALPRLHLRFPNIDSIMFQNRWDVEFAGS